MSTSPESMDERREALSRQRVLSGAQNIINAAGEADQEYELINRAPDPGSSRRYLIYEHLFNTLCRRAMVTVERPNSNAKTYRVYLPVEQGVPKAWIEVRSPRLSDDVYGAFVEVSLDHDHMIGHPNDNDALGAYPGALLEDTGGLIHDMVSPFEAIMSDPASVTFELQTDPYARIPLMDQGVAEPAA